MASGAFMCGGGADLARVDAYAGDVGGCVRGSSILWVGGASALVWLGNCLSRYHKDRNRSRV
jgi:hypothetical protein